MSIQHIFRNLNLFIVSLTITLISTLSTPGQSVFWQEGENITSAPDGLEKIKDMKWPGSGGSALYGAALDKKGYVVTYDLELKSVIKDAQMVVRYARLHWRDTMVPAEFEITLNGNNQSITKRASFDNTGGWGAKNANEFDFVSFDLGTLTPGKWQIQFKSLADNNSINVDGFFLADQSFDISNDELDPLIRVAITSEGYVGLNRPATVIRQDMEKSIDFAVRIFTADRQPRQLTATLTDESGKKISLVLSGRPAQDENDVTIIKMLLPDNLPDGQYSLDLQANWPDWELSVPVELAGQFLGQLDDQLVSFSGIVGKLEGEGGQPNPQTLTDFNHLLQYLATSKQMIDQATEPAQSEWKRGLAQHEGASNAASVIATMRRVADQAEAMKTNILAGKDAFAGMTGLMLRAYKSNQTGEIWPFHVYLPASCNTAEKLPFIFFLHGGGGDEDYWPQLHGGLLLDILEKRNYIAVMPRWHSRNQPPEDVLQLYDLVIKDYPKIDPARKFATGVSMGGFGSYRFATQHPDLFTGICCVSGSGDPEAAVALEKIPTMILQGGSDTVVPPKYAEAVAAQLEKLGYTYELHIFPTYGHGYYPEYLPMSIDFWEKYVK